MPYDSFWWQGIDGTQVLTHFTTTPDQRNLSSAFRTYNADASPAVVLHSWNNLQHKEHQSTLLMSYGYGDGGGGPTREMLENIRDMAHFPGMPQTRHDKVGNFFKALEAEAGASLPTWNGELYFELHRGTYTTQARLKRANRRSEFALHDAEFLAALASQLDADYTYPREALWRAWELVCLNQFHDIIPGTSIAPVYPEALAHHAEVQSTAAGVREKALQTIGSRLDGDVLVANPTSFARSDLVLWRDAPKDVAGLETAGGQIIPGQRTDAGVLFAVEDLAPYSIQGYSLLRDAAPPPTGLTVSEAHLENDHVRVEFGAAGDITRIYDKQHAREVLPQGAVANQFQLFEDRPQNWDAWDIDIYYTDRMWPAEPAASVTVEAAGPLRATLRIERRIHNSTYTQRVSLDYNSPLVRFDTHIDWQERHMLLKVAFPVEVLASAATYEIQWGSLQRPTHWNTSWDWARFEACAQKWVDLSEGGYGVSLLNDCKYGHDIKDNVIRLTLLRATTEPDPTADVGEHTFSYALLPHAGDWRSGTVPAAYHMNNPTLIAAKAGRNRETGELTTVQLASVDADHVVIETIKQAEDGRGVILRLYESQQKRGEVHIKTMAPIKAAWRCDLLETDKEQIVTDGSNTLSLHVRPFEIQTLRLVF
jgi:alpha-mannosidase